MFVKSKESSSRRDRRADEQLQEGGEAQSKNGNCQNSDRRLAVAAALPLDGGAHGQHHLFLPGQSYYLHSDR